MAANSTSRGVANLGKRLLTNQIWTPLSVSAPSFRRGNHTSVYDKNVEDNVRPVIVPDVGITHPEAEKFWSPNPNNGIFGPTSEQNPAGERGFHTSPGNGGGESVLEVKTFIRSLEDLEKPQHP